MYFAFLIKLYLIVLYAAVAILADSAKMVLNGLVLQEALSEATKLCPEKLVGAEVKKLKQKIHTFMAPTKSVKDPLRKTYAQQVPGRENVKREVDQLCQIQGNYESFPGTELTEEKPAELEENLSSELESDGSVLFDEDLKYRSLFLFFLGMVCGMFFVFGYFYHMNKAVPVNSNKLLRRPEL